MVNKSAIVSDCGKYRYLLTREWAEEGKICLWVMLNPSTADALNDDATVRSCGRLARYFGYSGFTIVNLFARRATDPNDLKGALDPIGPKNDTYICDEFLNFAPDDIIAAWGSHPIAISRGAEVRRLLPHMMVLGLTQMGAPKHPLYIKTGTPLARWPACEP